MSDSALILPLIRRLEGFSDLSAEEACALKEAAGPIRTYGSHQYFLHEREQTAEADVIVSGFACQHLTLANGRRQIVGYFLPGDMCTSRSFMLRNIDVDISTLVPTSIVPLSRRAVIDVTSRYPQLTRALWWHTLVEEASGING
jgi:CRP-like cAMP-binding protein